jgi:Tfp pilus assembly protein PilV
MPLFTPSSLPSPQQRNGFTVLETVIAIGIIVFGVLSLISLGTVMVNAARQVNHEFIAANSAREAVEIIRSQRDSNWLQYEVDATYAWDTGLVPPQGIHDHSAVLVDYMNQPFQGYRLDFAVNDDGTQCSVGETTLAYNCSQIWEDQTAQQERYFQTVQTDFAFSQFLATPYRRVLMLHPICRNTIDETQEEIITDVTQTCESLGADQWEYVGLDVIVTVYWGNEGKYVLEEQLYDWKK